MDDSSKLLLQALACALHGESVPWEAGSVSSWPELRHLAAAHNVLPLLAQALWDSPIAAAEPAPVRALALRAKQLAADAESAGKLAVESALQKADEELKELSGKVNAKATSEAEKLSKELENQKAALRAKAQGKLDTAAAKVVERIVNS